MSPWRDLVPIGGSTDPANRPTLEHLIMIVWSSTAHSDVGIVERLKRPVALVLPASAARPWELPHRRTSPADDRCLDSDP